MLQSIKSFFDFSGENKKRNIILISSICGALLVTVTAIIIVFFLLFNSKASISDFITVKDVSGYSGSGTVELTLDYAELAQELGIEDKLSVRSLISLQEEDGYSFDYLADNFSYLEYEYDYYFGEFGDLFNNIDVNIEHNGAFCNGDTAFIEIIVNPNGRFGDKLSGDVIKKEIDGLTVLKDIELNFECDFVGFNGEGYLSCTITDDYQEWHDSVYFTCENDGSLSNGDTVYVEAYFNDYDYSELYESFLTQEYFLPQSFVMEFTVTDLVQPLTLEECNDDILDQAEQIVKDNVQLSDPTLVPRVSMVYFADDYNSSCIAVALEFPDEKEGKVWNHIKYLKNVGVTEDGELKYTSIEHILGGNGFSAENQAEEIEDCDDFDYYDLTRVR